MHRRQCPVDPQDVAVVDADPIHRASGGFPVKGSKRMGDQVVQVNPGDLKIIGRREKTCAEIALNFGQQRLHIENGAEGWPDNQNRVRIINTALAHELESDLQSSGVNLKSDLMSLAAAKPQGTLAGKRVKPPRPRDTTVAAVQPSCAKARQPSTRQADGS